MNKQQPWLVIGAKGMLGTDLITRLKTVQVEAIGIDIDDIDIRSYASVKSVFASYSPGLAINVAAYTDVDGCESEMEQAYKVNADGPKNLARICSEIGIILMHISTDYVFDGTQDRPYREDDPVNPLGVYGKSKAMADSHIREILPHMHCIVRTQWLFGVHGKNFIETIISLAHDRDELTVVDDQHGSPTWTVDLAEALIALSELDARGPYHVTNSGSTTWYELARRAIQLADIKDVLVKPINTEQLGRPAPRPAHSVLDNSKYNKLIGNPLPRWEDALSRYMKARANL